MAVDQCSRAPTVGSNWVMTQRSSNCVRVCGSGSGIGSGSGVQARSEVPVGACGAATVSRLVRHQASTQVATQRLTRLGLALVDAADGVGRAAAVAGVLLLSAARLGWPTHDNTLNTDARKLRRVYRRRLGLVLRGRADRAGPADAVALRRGVQQHPLAGRADRPLAAEDAVAVVPVLQQAGPRCSGERAGGRQAQGATTVVLEGAGGRPTGR